jgi:hypothetical protein
MFPFSRAWLFDWTDREAVCENKVIKVDEQVPQFENPSLDHRVVLVLGKYQRTGEPVNLKLQYESVLSMYHLSHLKKLPFFIFNFRLNPKYFSPGDVEATRKLTQALFHKELECVEDAFVFDRAPAFLNYDLYYQTASISYPGGYLFLLAMGQGS